MIGMTGTDSKTILIATHSNNPVSQAVAQKLQEKNYAPLLIYTDKICQRLVPFSFTFKEGRAILQYGSTKLDLLSVGSAWYWRAIVKGAASRTDKIAAIEREMQKTLGGIWETIDNSKWLNRPHAIKRTQNKLMQLRYAHAAGLRVIPTVATNDWSVLQSEIVGKIIVKMPGKGLLEYGDQADALYTTTIDTSAISTLRHASPFPGMYQPFLSKKREWRVTIVADQVFSAAIYTDQVARTDWRKYAQTNTVRFVAEPFPTNIATQCKELLKLLELRYGAFDFIETEDGSFYFVEVNSNGQFLWLEEQFGLPISAAIAEELICIASGTYA